MPYLAYIENLDECRREWDLAVVEVEGGTVKGVRLGVEEGIAEALATRRWQDRTGATRRATRGYLTVAMASGAAEAVMEVAVPHATFLSEGTVPHDIWPKAAGGSGKGSRQKLKPGQSRRKAEDVGTHRVALRWYDSGGGVVFATMVHHPGTKPDAFMANAYLKCERVIIQEAELGVERAQRILDR